MEHKNGVPPHAIEFAGAVDGGTVHVLRVCHARIRTTGFPGAGQRGIRRQATVRNDLWLVSFRWGRAAGKGPQLMNTARDDDYLRNRIRQGKSGAMPAFGETFSDAQIDEIIKYIRQLKPHEG